MHNILLGWFQAHWIISYQPVYWLQTDVLLNNQIQLVAETPFYYTIKPRNKDTMPPIGNRVCLLETFRLRIKIYTPSRTNS